jgi:hypothetical protein
VIKIQICGGMIEGDIYGITDASSSQSSSRNGLLQVEIDARVRCLLEVY